MSKDRHDLYPIGTKLLAENGGEGIRGIVVQHDASDTAFPLLINVLDDSDQPTGDAIWIHFDDVQSVNTAETPDAPAPANLPDEPLELVQAAQNELDAFYEVTRSHRAAMNALVLKLGQRLTSDKPKVYEPRGACTSCFEDVRMDVRTGKWEHITTPDDKHSPAAIVIAASREF